MQCQNCGAEVLTIASWDRDGLTILVDLDPGTEQLVVVSRGGYPINPTTPPEQAADRWVVPGIAVQRHRCS